MLTYLQHLVSIAIPNKYTKWYASIVENSTYISGYGEKHHVLPKSFNLGGETDPNNLIMLTAREHYICHLLLTKMFADNHRRHQMITAFVRMSNSKTPYNEREYKSNSILYEAAKKSQSEYMKANNHNADGRYSKAAWAKVPLGNRGIVMAANWKSAPSSRREMQSALMSELNRKLKTKPKEVRTYSCSCCGATIYREEFCHHAQKPHYYCNMKCKNVYGASLRPSRKGIPIPPNAKRVPWNKGIKGSTTFGDPLKNPMKNPESKQKMLESRKKNRADRLGNKEQSANPQPTNS